MSTHLLLALIAVIAGLAGIVFTIFACNGMETDDGQKLFTHASIAAFIMEGSYLANGDVGMIFIVIGFGVMGLFALLMVLTPSPQRRSA